MYKFYKCSMNLFINRLATSDLRDLERRYYNAREAEEREWKAGDGGGGGSDGEEAAAANNRPTPQPHPQVKKKALKMQLNKP